MKLPHQRPHSQGPDYWEALVIWEGTGAEGDHRGHQHKAKLSGLEPWFCDTLVYADNSLEFWEEEILEFSSIIHFGVPADHFRSHCICCIYGFIWTLLFIGIPLGLHESTHPVHSFYVVNITVFQGCIFPKQPE